MTLTRWYKTHPQVDRAAPATAAIETDAANGSDVVAPEEEGELDDGLELPKDEAEGEADAVIQEENEDLVDAEDMHEEVRVAKGDTVGADEKVAVAEADDVLLELAVLLEVVVKVNTTSQGSHCDGKTLITINP